ncbi:hypothetical protein JR316_0004037 [Psilocybe cubensis]|uniref:Uncharacterized protein n=2 Tax=Psilocybe cubensis TaxID=181762 RepID=A0ACB8H967_PSICU|nr:hypothetical protein JR316_0004037 [Psilocybe cubensis]KAH9484555.1 hypothetical protein JR316_0004037 [Psilocybe cubensis]
MQGIMIYRVSSMYSHNRKIIFLFALAAFIEAASMIAIQTISTQVDEPVPNPAPGVFLCTQRTFPSWMYITWIPIMIFEILVLGLSVSLGLRYYKTVRTLATIRVDPSHKPDSLAYILLRDSITFPFLCLAACILNLIVWIHLPHAYIQLAFGIASFVPCVLGPRLILNLREAYYEPFNRECDDSDLQESGPHEYDHRGSARHPRRRLGRYTRGSTLDMDSETVLEDEDGDEDVRAQYRSDSEVGRSKAARQAKQT